MSSKFVMSNFTGTTRASVTSTVPGLRAPA
jgi:hypothetical protein